MENQIKAAFDGVLMPDNCSAKIEQAIERSAEVNRSRRVGWHVAAAAACLLLVLAVFSNPTVVQALEEMFVPVTPGMDNAFYISSNWVSYYKNGTGGEADHCWNLPSGTLSGRLNTDPWLVQEDDRLLFTANGEMIDITDQISFETPFTYIFVDKQNLIHYLAVGGKFEAEQGVESVGTVEYVRHKLVMDANPGSLDAGWLSNTIRGSDAFQNGFSPWVYEAFEIMELPKTLLEYAPEPPPIPVR